jgi:mono/diheme cytochrome c family protein
MSRGRAARIARVISLRLLALCGAAGVAELAAAATPHYSDGASIFAANCALCHGANGAGQPALAPPLLANPARYAALAEGRRQLVMTVLYGMFGDITVEQKHYNFKMPDFSRLDDAVLSAVLNFVVFDLSAGGEDIPPVAPAEIAAERSQLKDGAAVREHRAAVLQAIGGG